MSLKSLFGKDKKTKNISSLVSSQEKLDDVESIGYIDQFLKDRKRFKTHTNFFTASNFAAYGSLEEYYKSGIDRISNTYPYDGSLKERLSWYNDSSGFDLHLFENEYPRTNGYVKISDNRPGGAGWGSVTSTSGAYGNPATKEYIYIKGGPNVGNVYATASSQTSNLEINGRTGNTVEFWLKKTEYVSSKTEREVILDITTTGSVEGDHKYGRLTVELDSSDEDKSPFLVTYQSGSTGFKDVRLGHPQLYTSGSDSAWHHYAISLKNESSAVKAAIYVDGEPNKIILTGSSVGSLNTAMVGSIGALVAYKDELHAGSDSQPVVAHNAISFDGIDDVVVVSDQDAFSPTDGSTDKAFSISAWVYVGDVSADNGPFVAKSNNTIATRNEYIFKHGNGEVQFFLYDSALSAQGNAIRAQADAATLSDATWHHVVATYDGSTNASGIKIYTDASQTAATNDEAGTYVKLRNTATPLTFGATEDAGSANRIFEDRMADVVIFDKELSSAEVTEIYNTGKILEMTTFSAYSNIVSWFKMGDGDDTTGTGGIKDYVSGYNGTLTNDAAIITISGIKGEVQRLQYPGRGYGKLSGSLDDFRYWKKERSSKDVGRFWFTQIGAGSNTDPANSPLGFYYKFNEGEVGITTVDKTVLDYSGRVSNGQWVGYAGYGRYNNSAMVESSASLTEFKDPIIYQNHPLVSSFRQETAERGYAYDLLNASSMYYSYPDWIVDEDGESGQDLKKITQVVASYFDSLFLQIKDMGELRHLKYQDFDKKPHPFNNVKLQSMGLVTPELFMDASTLNNLVNRGEDKEFRQDTSDIKNFIYNNIHNNLESIFKSKGTEKAFRNLFRCFGVDDELIKINLYSTDSVYPIETSYQNSTVKTKYVNFADNINKKASVFQSIDGVVSPYRTADARGFMKGTNGLISDDDAVSIGLTAEAQIYLPKIYPISHPFHFASPLSSSVLGCHNVGDETDDTVLTWTSSGNDHSNFQLYVVKEKIHSRTAKFVLKSRNDIFEAMESDYIVDLYDSNRWNVAMRLASDTPAGSNITGSGNSYRFELYGAKTVADEIQDSFSVQRSITATNAKNFIKNSRRFYIGAERDGFEGALQHESDVKVANFRVWNTELSNDEINAHAIDPRSYGVDNPSRVSFPLADIGNTQLTKIDLLAINWNFANLTGSNSNGDMWINDVSSGSIEDDHTFGKLAPAIRRLHPGKGINFASATTSSVDVEYDQATRLQPFENVKASDMVKVVLNDDLTFTRETKPTDFFFSFEKSMYAAVTDEMLNFFAGINEFSNLIGAPVERFRPNYKGLSKLRQVFFSRIENSPDIERYTEYYKWLDSSLSVMIDQLVPASVAASEDIRNVIESHILERSKYYNKFPTMEFKSSEPVGQIRGINELTYDWQYGHAPINKGANNHCLWTKERAQRSTDILVSGSEAVDPDREIIRRVSITSVSGSTYATRRLSRPYRLSVEDQRHAKGGDNTFGNKKKRLFTGISTAHGKSYMVVTGSELTTDSCKDIINPSKKKKFHATADIAFTGKDLDINDVAPFTIYSSSLDPISGYQALLYRDFKKGVDITNIHSDEYGDDREVTLQSPFTERWVGGNQHRHQDAMPLFQNSPTADITISDGTTEAFGHNSVITITSPNNVTREYVFRNDVDYGKENTRVGVIGVLVPATDAPVSSTGSIAVQLASAIKSTNGHAGVLSVVVSNSNQTLTLKYESNEEPTAGGSISETIVDPQAEGLAFAASAMENGGTITLTDESSNTQVFIIDNSVTTADGSRDGSNRVIVGINGVAGSGPAEVRQLVLAVNASNALGYHNIRAKSSGIYLAFYSESTTVTNAVCTDTFSDAGAFQQVAFGTRTKPTVTFDVNFKRKGINDGSADRLEAFRILAKDSKLYVLPPNSSELDTNNHPIIDPNKQVAQVLREPLAKRPVNIGNIPMTASVRSLGNYNHIYDIVQYTSEDQRKDFLVDNLEQITSSNSTGIPGVQEFAKFARPVRKSVFKARFASPGGTEVSGDSRGGHSLDRATNQYSVYNSLNYRNLSVRGPLDFLNKIPQTGSTDSNSLVTNHKINSNPRHRRRLSDALYSGEVDVNKDNAFVQHPIPQNDYQYAWITASLVTGRSPVEIAGHLHSFTQASLGTATGSLSGERTYEFLTASNRIGANVIDFAGLNTYIQDDIDVATNTVTAASTYNLTGTIHHRQGPYGWPSWKQIRAGDSALGRYFRKNNLYSIPVSNGAASFRTRGNYSWPDNIVHRKGFSDRSVADSNYRFTEPPVSSNRLPITLRSEVLVPADVLSYYRDSYDGMELLPVPFKKGFSFNNKITRFANDNLTKVLSVEPTRTEERENLLTDDLKGFDFTKEGAVAEYSIEIFPKEKNAYLERTRERTQYTADDFWKSKREGRTKTDHANSQGNTIPKLSVWPLDAHDNFDTTALKKTTDKLGSDGSGELFANYSIFHNNLTHPSASALFARPMPYQSTSSLPSSTTFKYIDFRIAFTLNQKVQFESKFVIAADTTRVSQTASPHLATADQSMEHDMTPDVTTLTPSLGAAFSVSKIHPSFTNDASEDHTDAGPGGSRRYNDGQTTNVYSFPHTLIGTRTAAASVTNEPGSDDATNTHYRFLEYTGSLSDRPHLFRLHLRTGFAGTDDAFGLRTSTKPLYLQMKGDTVTAYNNVAKFMPADYKGSQDGEFQYVSLLVTASYGANTKFRFICPTQDSDTDGLWSFTHLTIYEGNHAQSDVFTDSRNFAAVSTITSSTALQDVSFRTVPTSTRYVSPQTEFTPSLVSFGKIDLYRDEKNKNFTRGDIFKSEISSPDIPTHDHLLKQNSDTHNIASVYAKDDKLDHHLYGSQFFRTPEHASRNPFNFDNYEGFAAQAKLLAKDYSLIPEFRISEHMDYYINTIGGADPFFACNDTFLKITGSTSPDDSSQDTFYEVYTHTDFVKHFGVVEEEMKQVKGASATKLKLECKAYKKFLPYKGFYPADRMTQLASEFSSSYAQFVTGGHWRNVLSPYYAPGIGFNTIKSGIAVDYPIIEPNADRLYNQFGVIFQSASLAIDEGGNAVQALTGRPWVSGEGGAGSAAKLSTNRIEIGGGSQWADVLTGSASPGASDKRLTISLWMYLPKSFPSTGDGELSHYGNLVQKGCLASFGSGESTDDAAWKKGLHFGYYVSSNHETDDSSIPGNLTSNSNFAIDDIVGSGDDNDYLVDRDYNMSFVVMGGDGKDFFALSTEKTTEGDTTPNSQASPGWNHVLLTCDPDGIGTVGNDHSGFKAYVNGVEYESISHLTSSTGFSFSSADTAASNTGDIVLDGSRNCFIGAHLGYVKKINASSPANLRPRTYQSNQPVFITTGTNRLSTGGTNQLNAWAPQTGLAVTDYEHHMADFLKPSEVMMTEIVVLNAFDNHMPEALSGFPSGKSPASITFGNLSKTTDFKATARLEEIPLASDLGHTYGAANPYTTLSSSFHQNIVGWYRPGNDGGYCPQWSSVNGTHIFNHAQDLFSGKIPNPTGSAETYDSYAMPKVYNHLTGTFYGFTEWTGSLANDLKYSNKLRQRWNGVADITNPSQYTYLYHYPRTDAVGSLGSKAPFKTWYTHLGQDNTWFANTTDYVEKTLVEANESLSSSFSICSGSVKIPSFIVGTKYNFTNDASIPRIGSASYGTYHFTGSTSPGTEPMYSQGFITDDQGDTGIKKVVRIPFEAIIDPALHTPETDSEPTSETVSALFYEVEPHPSSSLLGAFNRQRKYIGQNSHNQQVFKWTSALDKQHADDVSPLTDENFSLGVAMNSSSVRARFDLESARAKKTVYSLAANNFYAECLNLFLENKKGVTIRSADTPVGEVASGTEYHMSVELFAGYNRRTRRDNPMYNNPAAFGIPFDAGKLRAIHRDGTFLSRSAEHVGYGFSPYLPPHYDGYARASYVFTPQSGQEYVSIGQILADTSVDYYRRVSSTGSIQRKSSGFASNERPDANTVHPSHNRRHAMHISESFNGLSLSDDAFVQSYDTEGNPLEDRKSLVIQTKFECPTFDFGADSANQPRTGKITQHLPKIKGVWHQTGSYTSDNRPSVNIVTPSGITGKGDLSKLIGLSIEGGNRVGEMPEQVTIHEGVVAVPFKTFNNTRKFFNLPPEEVYQAVRNLGYSDYKLKTEGDRRRFREMANALDAASAGRSGGTIPQQDANRRVLDDLPSKMDVRPSIQQMVRSMMRYNLPPQFNFLKYNDPEGKYIKPFAMYMFDFSVDLPKADIARIWQNVTPDIGLDNFGSRNPNNPQVISSRIVEHDLFNIDDLLDPKAEIVPDPDAVDGYVVEDWQGGLDKDTQWMVFKVKQKAEADYFRKKELDRLPDGHPEKKISVENDIFKYGFNWPYDYFSLVELVNLKATVGFTNKNSVIDEETARILQSRRDNE